VSDLKLFQNGNRVSIDSPSVSVVAETTTRFRISGLSALNASGGDYRLVVDTTGINDTVGNSGFSESAAVWSVSAASIIVTPNSGLITTDAGGTATFTVRLNRAPSADVRIPVSSSSVIQGTVSVSELVFTA